MESSARGAVEARGAVQLIWADPFPGVTTMLLLRTGPGIVISGVVDIEEPFATSPLVVIISIEKLYRMAFIRLPLL
jgi:hypothetical protein